MYAGNSPFALKPWTLRIIAANAIVHLLAISVFANTDIVSVLAFVPARSLQQPWTIITYQFLHGGLLHLAFNMLALFIFGSAVEEHMGSRYPLYYLFCGIGGAALSFVFAYNSPIIGASAAVYGVALAYAFFWPDRKIMVFPLPVPIKVKWLVAFLAATSLFWATGSTTDNVAHFAHLGGFAAGAIYLFATKLRQPRSTYKPAPEVFVHPTAKPKASPPAKTNRWSDEKLYRDVDRVLDKISESGMESLTAEERKILDESSKHMKHH